MAEQFKFINECCHNSITDTDWCRKNDITASTFYKRVSLCWKAAVNEILEPNYGHEEMFYIMAWHVNEVTDDRKPLK